MENSKGHSMKKPKRDYQARIVIYGLPEDKDRICNWLIQTAKLIKKKPEKYAKRFVAKLMIPTF